MRRLLSLFFWLGLAQAQGGPPNIVLFLADDQGWGDLGFHGNANLKTPHIESLARNGATLKSFFVCPVCAPTRAELLTGRYHTRCGVRDVSMGGERLNLDERTLADVLKKAGYATGLFGKWHNGTQWPYHPLARGFDSFYGFTSGHWGSYFDAPMDLNGKPTMGKGYMTDDITNHAMNFMEQKATTSKPFFCMVAFNTPHSPMQVPDAYWRRFEKLPLIQKGGPLEDENFTRAALAMVENIDDNVGRVLAKLDRLNQTNDTIVVYLSDNGPNSNRFNGPWKGRKGSVDEGGVLSPCFVRYPAKIKPGTTVGYITGAIDILPTLAALAGVSLGESKPLDGKNLAPLLAPMLEGDNPRWPFRTLYSHWVGKVGARTDTFRMDAEGKLFNMETDPGQTKDASTIYPEDSRNLRNAITGWKELVGIPMPKDDRPFPVGYLEMPNATLPARDGKSRGGIVRSAPAPNDSFFHNWTKLTDVIHWDVEVARAGKYEAVLHLTLKQGDSGAKVKLSLGTQSIEALLEQPHDPALKGGENDRVPRRGESYIKDFRPVSLGTIALNKGRGQLELRALAIPGAGVSDVKALELRLNREKGSN